MCLSRLGQIIYGIAMFVALALTLSGAFTPGWRQLEGRVNGTYDKNDPQATSHEVKEKINVGLFNVFCSTPGETAQPNGASAQAVEDYCKNWWKNRPNWEKTVISLVCLTVVFEVIALVYNFVTFCCCCCRGHALKPLAPLALICFLTLATAIAIYGIKNKEALNDNRTIRDFSNPENTIGYSFFLECGAAVLLFINIIIGSTSACLGDKCL